LRKLSFRGIIKSIMFSYIKPAKIPYQDLRVSPTYFKKPVLVFFIFAIIFAFSGTPVFAATSLDINGNPEVLVCDVLGSLGLDCGAPSPSVAPVNGQANNTNTQPVATPEPQRQTNQQANIGNALQASIANVTVKRNASKDEVMLVRISAVGTVRPTLGLETNDAIFEIIRGQKHFIPTIDIFFDYGFNLAAVQSVTNKDLEPFPRTKVVNIYKSGKNIHYITEGHMIRMIPNKDVFASYGDREEDVITISKKEFNFYPRNQYVFVENPLARDIFQVSDDGTKRYVVPQVVKRLRITPDQVAPVNKEQFDAYNYGVPIIF